MIELKPCPFCNGSEVYRDYKKISWNGRLSTITVFTEDRLIKRLELKYE